MTVQNYTTLPIGTLDGDKIVDDDLGDGTKLPVSKIATGVAGTNDGAVHRFQPFPVIDVDMRRLLEDILFTLQRLVELQEFTLREGEPVP